jgi:hypothetical protein
VSDETAAGFTELETEKARLGADPGEEEDEAEADEVARADSFTRFIGWRDVNENEANLLTLRHVRCPARQSNRGSLKCCWRATENSHICSGSGEIRKRAAKFEQTNFVVAGVHSTRIGPFFFWMLFFFLS